MDLTNKTVVLTGGSSGIGLELVKRLAEHGAMVYSFDRHPFPLSLQGVVSIVADVGDGDQVRHGLQQVKEPIDVLFNNAGVMRRGDLFQSSEEDFDVLFHVHVKASWLMLRESQTKLHPNATIVQMCSRHALNPKQNPALYSLAKLTAMHLAEMVARDYPEYRVKLLFPGSIDTPLAGHGLTEEELVKKRETMHTVEEAVEKILEVVKRDDLSRLEFDEEKWEYVAK